MISPQRPSLAEIAERIDAHLKRFEADPAINLPMGTGRARMYRNAGAYYFKHGVVVVQYVAYHTATSMDGANAWGYLQWLDAGGIGKHWDWGAKQ